MRSSGSALAFDGRPSRLVPNTLLLVAAAASVATWLTPNIYEPWLSFHGELWMAVAGLLASAVAVAGMAKGRSRLPWLAVGLFASASVPVAQGLGGLVRFAGDVWLTALYLVGAGFAAWATWIATERWGPSRVVGAILGCLLIGGVATLFLALCQWQGLEVATLFVMPGEDGLRPSGNIGQPNQFATLLVCSAIALAHLHERRRIGGATAFAAVTFVAFGIAMTQSRTALLEVVLVGLLLAAWAWRKAFGVLTPTRIAFGVLVVLSMPLVWEAVRHWSPFGAAARTVADVTVAGVRPLHWAALWDAVLRRPWLGYGWSAIGEAQFTVAPDHPASHETLNHAHNLVLELLVTNGVPLGLLLIGALALWFKSAAAGVRDPSARLAYGAVLAIFVHALLEYPLHYVDFLLPTASLMGCISFVATPRHAVAAPALAAKAVWLSLAVAVAVTAVDYLDFEADRRHMRFKAANIGTPVRAWPPSDRMVLTQLGAFWNFLIEPERRGMTAAQLDAMRDVVLRFPSVENMIRYAAALGLNGRPAEASAVLSRGCKMTPLSHCRELRRYWQALGTREPELAGIEWPGLPPH